MSFRGGGERGRGGGGCGGSDGCEGEGRGGEGEGEGRRGEERRGEGRGGEGRGGEERRGEERRGEGRGGRGGEGRGGEGDSQLLLEGVGVCQSGLAVGSLSLEVGDHIGVLAVVIPEPVEGVVPQLPSRLALFRVTRRHHSGQLAVVVCILGVVGPAVLMCWCIGDKQEDSDDDDAADDDEGGDAGDYDD